MSNVFLLRRHCLRFFNGTRISLNEYVFGVIVA